MNGILILLTATAIILITYKALYHQDGQFIDFWPITWSILCVIRLAYIGFIFYFLCLDFTRQVHSGKIYFYMSLGIILLFIGELAFKITIMSIILNRPCNDESCNLNNIILILVYVPIFLFGAYTILTFGLFSSYVFNVQKQCQILKDRHSQLNFNEIV